MIYIPLWWGVDMVGVCVLSYNKESHTYKSLIFLSKESSFPFIEEEVDYEKTPGKEVIDELRLGTPDFGFRQNVK